MTRVHSLDGGLFEFDEETLRKYEVPHEVVQKMSAAFSLPPPPADPPASVQTSPPVRVRRGPGNSIIIDIHASGYGTPSKGIGGEVSPSP